MAALADARDQHARYDREDDRGHANAGGLCRRRGCENDRPSSLLYPPIVTALTVLPRVSRTSSASPYYAV